MTEAVLRWRLPLALVFVAALLPTLANQPLYLITDDIAWLSWAHSSQGAPLNFLTDAPGTGYRPLINFIWFYGYALFGVNGLAFQLANGLFFALAAVYVYRLGKLLGGEAAGLLSALLFVALDTSYVLVYWSAYLTTTVELCFMVAALFYVVRAWERRSAAAGSQPPHPAARITGDAADFWERVDPFRRRWTAGLVLGLGLAVLAYMAKEMALVLLPLGLLAYALLSYRRLKVPRAALLGVPAALGAVSLVLLLTFYPIAGQAGGGGLGQAADNLPYYLNLLFSYELAAPLVVAGCGYMAVRRMPVGAARTLARVALVAMVLFSLAAPSAETLLATTATDASGNPIDPFKVFNPFSALLLLVLVAALAAGDRRQRTMLAWFFGGLGVLLFLGLEPQATYLQELLVGLCLALGLAYRDFGAELRAYVSEGAPRLFTIRGLARAAAYIVLAGALVAQVAFAAHWAGVAQSYGSDLASLEGNFRSVVEDMARTLPPNATVFGFDYNGSQFPSLYYGRVYHMGSLAAMFPLLGRPDVTVRPITSIINESEVAQHRGEEFVVSYVLYYQTVHNNVELGTAYQQYAQGLLTVDEMFSRLQISWLDELWVLKVSSPQFYQYIDATWPVDAHTRGRNTILVYTIS